MNFKKNLLIVPNAINGFSVFNISNPKKIFEINSYKNEFVKSDFTQCQITSNDFYIACTSREAGLIIFEFYNFFDLNMLSYIEKLGAERFLYSKDENYIFIANGFQGLIIIDVRSK